jgi:hypothetical protein
MTYISKNTKLYLIVFLFLFLSGCKIDFVGDVYTSDLISIAEKGGSINVPMEISFQVNSCDGDNSSLNNKIESYFIDYKQIDCGTRSDFMSYITSKVSVPITNSFEEFITQNTLVGYGARIFPEDKESGNKEISVFLQINPSKLESLSDYVMSETYSKLSLTDSKFKININNDIDSTKIRVFPSIIDGVPEVYKTDFVLNKREKITIENSNVSSMFLELNGYTPLFDIASDDDITEEMLLDLMSQYGQ